MRGRPTAACSVVVLIVKRWDWWSPNSLSFAYSHRALSILCWIRKHAARHSALLMCVPLSQNPIQSCKLLPPPPGALGAFSLGLPVSPTPEPGDSARAPDPVPPCVLPPDDSDGWGSEGERGATGAACCIGVPITDGGVEPWFVDGGLGTPPVLRPMLGAAVPELPARPPPPPRCATARPQAKVRNTANASDKARMRSMVS